jgi:hypothetical protein
LKSRAGEAALTVAAIADPYGGPFHGALCEIGKQKRVWRFATKIVRERGHVSEADFRAVKLAGYDDAQVIEIVLHIALNTWTNYINEVARTDIDFPVVTVRKAACGARASGAAVTACRVAGGRLTAIANRGICQ